MVAWATWPQGSYVVAWATLPKGSYVVAWVHEALGFLRGSLGHVAPGFLRKMYHNIIKTPLITVPVQVSGPSLVTGWAAARNLRGQTSWPATYALTPGRRTSAAPSATRDSCAQTISGEYTNGLTGLVVKSKLPCVNVHKAQSIQNSDPGEHARTLV